MTLKTTCFMPLVFTLLLIFDFPSHSQIPPLDGKNDKNFQGAVRLMDAGKYETAIGYLQKAVQNNPRCEMECLRIAEAYTWSHRLDEGIAFFGKASQKSPQNPYIQFALGCLYREKKNYSKALEQFQKTLEAVPDYGRAYRGLVDVYSDWKRQEFAEAEIRKDMRSHPDRASAHYGMGYLYALQSKWDEALREADAAIRLDGRFMDAYHLRAIVLSSTGRYNEVFEISRTGLKIAEAEYHTEFRCTFLGNMGYAKYFLADYPGSLENCGKALQLASDNGFKEEEIRDLQFLGNSYRDTGRLDEALDCMVRGLKAARQIGDKRREGTSYRLIGTVYNSLSNFPEAKSYFQKALPIAVETGNDNLKALVLFGLGNVSWNLGDYENALTSLDEGLRISVKRNDEMVQQMCLGSQGLVYWSLGRYSQALECHEKALAIARKHGLKLWEGVHLGNMAIIFHDVGDYSTALTYYDQALRIAAETGSKVLQSTHLSNMAGIYSVKLKQYDKAMEYYRKALDLVRQIGDQRLETEFLGNMGDILITVGKWSQADSTLRQALEIARRIGHKSFEAWVLVRQGRLSYDRHDLDRAMSCYRNSLAMGKKLSIPLVVRESFLWMGTVFERQGLYKQALTQYRKAIDEIENFRESLSTEEFKTFFMENEFGAYEKMIHLLEVMHRKHPQQGYDRESFRYAEMAKARSFLDVIHQANIFQNLEKIPRELREAYISNNTLLEKNFQTLSETMNQADAARDRISRIEQDIETMQRKKIRLLEQINRSSPEYNRLMHPKTSSVEDVQQAILAENRVLVEYFVGDEAVYVWVLTGHEMRFQSVTLTKNSLEKALNQISPLFSRERENRTTAMDHRWANLNVYRLHDLYKILIQDPAGRYLTEGRELIIVADDLLNYFPFEILVSDVRGADVHYLIESHSVSYIGSSGLLGQAPERSGASDRNLLAFGNPSLKQDWKDRMLHPGRWFRSERAGLRNETFQSLPNAEKEVKAIAKNFKNPSVYIGRNATEGRFKKLSGGYRYIHLATHYLTSDNIPMISKVVLSQTHEESEDGYLQMYEVFNLHLNAELVVLSGCNTGSGKLHRGEGLIGMSRAFFYAGASSLAVSLWPVDDESTAILMKSFYGHMNEGLDKAKALREAKIEMIRSTGLKRNPFYWGPFILIGDSRRADIR